MKHSYYDELSSRIEVTAFAKMSDKEGVAWSLESMMKYMSSDIDNSRNVIEARSEYAANGKSKRYLELKAKLRFVTWNVSKFRRGGRILSNVSRMSGLMYFDVDGGKTKDDVLSSALAPYVIAMWSSVSGNGVGGIVWAPGVSKSNFDSYWSTMFELSGGILDKKCKDLPRINFLSFDPELWLAQGAVLGLGPGTPCDAASEESEKKNASLSAHAPTGGPHKNRSDAPRLSECVVMLTPGVRHATPVRTYPENRSFFFHFKIKKEVSEGIAIGRILEPIENKNASLSAHAPTGGPHNFCEAENAGEIERIATFLPKFVPRGRRSSMLSVFFRNYFIARPESFSLRTMIRMTNKMWGRFDGDVSYSDLKSIYGELFEEALTLGGLRPYSSPARLVFESGLSCSERRSLGGRHSGLAERNASENAMLDFIESYAGPAKLTSSVVGAGLGVNPSTVRRHMPGRIGDAIRKKNEELGLYKTKKSRTGSPNESGSENNRKARLGIESSPRAAAYDQDASDERAEEPEIEYTMKPKTHRDV